MNLFSNFIQYLVFVTPLIGLDRLRFIFALNANVAVEITAFNEGVALKVDQE